MVQKSRVCGKDSIPFLHTERYNIYTQFRIITFNPVHCTVYMILYNLKCANIHDLKNTNSRLQSHVTITVFKHIRNSTKSFKISKYANNHKTLRQRKHNSPGKAIVIVCGQPACSKVPLRLQYHYVSTILTILALLLLKWANLCLQNKLL